MGVINRTPQTHIQTKTAKAEALMAYFQKLQFRLILRVAGQIWQILQISAVICRILQISPGPANSKPKFDSKKLAKICSQKILQSRGRGCCFLWGDGESWCSSWARLISDSSLKRFWRVLSSLVRVVVKDFSWVKSFFLSSERSSALNWSSCVWISAGEF